MNKLPQTSLSAYEVNKQNEYDSQHGKDYCPFFLERHSQDNQRIGLRVNRSHAASDRIMEANAIGNSLDSGKGNAWASVEVQLSKVRQGCEVRETGIGDVLAFVKLHLFQ